MSFIGLLRTLEQITRPPRMGHDVDVEVRPCDTGDCWYDAHGHVCPHHCFDGAEQLAEREAETECLVPEDFKAVCRCVACVAEEQASAVDDDNDPSPTIVQSAPPPTVDGGIGGGGVLHSPGARLPHPDDAVAEWVGDAVPVILDVLRSHMLRPDWGRTAMCQCLHMFRSPIAAEDWRAHVAALVAARLAPEAEQ